MDSVSISNSSIRNIVSSTVANSQTDTMGERAFRVGSSGDGSVTFTESFNLTTTSTDSDEYMNCNVWGDPSRIVLQILTLATLLFNIAAAVVVFGVPITVRGRHVSFLFACVRILNLLDIWQCTIIFLFPMFIPIDCNASAAFCNVTGYLFTTATLFSPLIAIVMAVDRAVAVYFHVQYKANPRTEIKYIALISLLTFYGVYMLLPCFAHFGSYVAVPWLSLCSFEWGVKTRTFDLILASVTLFLITVLIAANVAIMVKMRKQKKQIEKMKKKSFKEQKKKKTKEDNGKETAKTFQMKKMHKSADDIIGISPEEIGTLANTPSRLSKRLGKQVPPPLQLKAFTNNLNKPKEAIDETELFHPNRNISGLVTLSTSSYTPPIRVNTRLKNVRPKSLIYPCTASSFSPRTPPLEINSSTTQPPSPLILFSDDGTRSKPPHFKSHSLNRSSSADNILNAHQSKYLFPKQQTPNLLRRVLDYPAGKPTKLDHQSSNYAGSSDENDTPVRKNTNSSTSSYFSFSFVLSKNASFPKRSIRRSRRFRRNVSKITKMTTIICMVFIVLYFPFLIRKLVQLIPADYGTVKIPVSLEIATLFGPLLSPLCNPIVYVFLNPHYKRHCIKLLRKADKKFWKHPCCPKANTVTDNKLAKRKKTNISTTQGVSSPFEKDARSYTSLDDVFLPNKCEKRSKKQAFRNGKQQNQQNR